MGGGEPDRSPGLMWRTAALTTKPDQHLGCTHILLLRCLHMCLPVNSTQRTRRAVTSTPAPHPGCLHAPLLSRMHAHPSPVVFTHVLPCEFYPVNQAGRDLHACTLSARLHTPRDAGLPPLVPTRQTPCRAARHQHNSPSMRLHLT